MFAWTEIAIRSVLIVVIVFNALIPTAAVAMPLAEENEVDSASVLSSQTSGAKGLRGQFLSSSLRSSTSFQENTPSPETPTPVLTETLTPESLVTPTSTPEATATPPVTETLEVTATASITPTPAGTSTTPIAPPTLLLEFSAFPYQIKTADQVTFTLKIVNQGQSPATGLQFSDILPEEFNFLAGRNKGFEFDAPTRELTWLAEPGTILLPGESLILEYTLLVVASKTEDVQITDSAHLSAGGFTEPLAVETTLILARPDSSFTTVDSQGGEASGLNGRLKLKFPKQSLDTSSMVSVRDLSKESSEPTTNEPWLKFELGVREPKKNTSLSTSSTTAGSLSADPASQETDEVVPLEFIEAQFAEPVELTVSFDGMADLATLTADITPFLVTLDEASGTWVRIPLEKIDREANLITAQLTHFSTWGVGFGPSFPQNGAGVILFDSAYPALFTGSSKYSIPIWTPPGRNGMEPSLALSYSSGSVEGVLGDVQAPWVGMGWSIDSAEIARKITNGGCNPCGYGAYGYENKFMLLLNGTGYELLPDTGTPGRYHTKDESFLYIQRYNNVVGSPSTANATGEWWEVVEKDGTRWRLGYTADAEQRAAMAGYPGTNPPPPGTGWATLGYAGNEPNVVALRWRADRVTDVYGNQMTFTYTEEARTVGAITYDRASYIGTISYTSHPSAPALSAGYSVEFVLVDRAGNDLPAWQTAWDNWDTKLLDRIDVKYGTTVLRKYDLGYQVISHTDGSPSVTWQTTILDSVAMSGGSTNAPTITFTYIEKDNRAAENGTSNEWAYPRLETINNGWGSVASYLYGHDSRPYTSWYNWRVNDFSITDSVSSDPMKSTFVYSTACYDDDTAGHCNASNTGSLVGYGQTTATTWNGTAVHETTVHKFHTDVQRPGREYQTQVKDANNTVRSQTDTQFTIDTYGTVPGGFYTWKYTETSTST